MNFFTQTQAAYKHIDSAELEQIIKSNGREITLIDVRSEGEHYGGHIPNSLNINVMGPQFVDQLSKLDKDKTYFVYCASGNRSKTACGQMAHMGFTDVTNLNLGMMGWNGEIE
jgi:phage shock protein E